MPRDGEPMKLMARLADAPARYAPEPRPVGVRLLVIFDRDDFAKALESPGKGARARPEP